MDIAILANFFLFLGALGLNLGLSGSDSSSGDTTDSLYNPNDYAGSNDGTSGADVITDAPDNQAWFLYGGDDSLTASAGDDFGDLGDGNDHADMGGGNDIAVGGNGEDTIAAGSGNDEVFGDAGNDSISGEAGNDALAGGTGDDSLWGLDGTDSLAGSEGNDLLVGGSGADVLYGGSGDDTLSGFHQDASGEASMTAIDGVDSLSGGTGNDALILGHGDIGVGGDGNDLFSLDLQWADGTEVAQIQDYVAASDHIEVHYTPHFDSTGAEIHPVLNILRAADGGSSMIQLDGQNIARINGQATVDPGTITLVAAT